MRRCMCAAVAVVAAGAAAAARAQAEAPSPVSAQAGAAAAPASGSAAQPPPTVPSGGAAAPAAAPLDLAALARQGARIAAIDIRIDNVFDLSNSAEDRPLYRWANRIHTTTRRSVIEDIILFAVDDPLDPRLIEETGRLLRAQGFSADAAVTVTAYDPATNTVTVDVWVRDAWSIEPDLKLSHTGGKTEWGLGFTEDNLLGLAKKFSISYTSNIDRDEAVLEYRDANIAGSRVRLDSAFADTSDGGRVQLSVGRPFYAFDTRWSAGGSFLDDERVDSVYDLGEVIDEFRRDARHFSVSGGWSDGFDNGRTRRWFAGWEYQEDLFAATPTMPQPVLTPSDRKLVYPWLGWQLIADDFRQMTELNNMGRTEDIALGLNLYVAIGLSSPEFGADRRATIFNGSVSKGWEPGGPGNLLLVDASAYLRDERDGLHDSVLTTRARYYHRNLGDNVFLTSLTTVLGENLDADRQVLLGGDNGLRGYPLRYQSGESSAVLTVEQRFFTDRYLFRLVRFGYAFFADAGRVWGPAARPTTNRGTLYDVGVGLRLTSPRGSSNSVLHIDLAFPLNADESISSVQLVVEKKSSI